MRDKQINKGQKFVSRYYPEQKLATVRGIEQSGKYTYVVYERIFKGASSVSTTIEALDKANFLAEFKEKEDFFVVGGEYKSKSGDLTYYIKEIYTISTPVSANYRKQARAVVINAAGKRWMEMLAIGDFGYAKRVK